MTFDAEGTCVRVPGQSNLPASAYVDNFPVLERYGIVFVRMGDADKADPALAFDMPELSQDGCRSTGLSCSAFAYGPFSVSPARPEH